MNSINYQKELEKELNRLTQLNKVPRLLLHSCCAPCSSYCIEYLSQYFEVTVFYYNPNIYPDEEYMHRVKEQQAFIKSFPAKYPVRFIEGDFDKKAFYDMARGLEKCPEGGERCFRCYELRLREGAKMAAKLGMDYFTTTLSISPLKNAAKLNELGQQLGNAYGVRYLLSDFKKKNGYKRSIELSKEYGMYRQDYCGCIYSFEERQRQKKAQQMTDTKDEKIESNICSVNANS